jgi:hypothetical protein
MSISLSGSLLITGSLTASGTLTAQTLVVQTVTSSIVYSSGSNIFGNSLTDTQQMTGSLRVTGSGNHYILGGNVGIGTANPSQLFEVVGGEIKAGRVDSSNEGGQVSFGRASDNSTAWYIDAYGNVASPQLRFVNVSNAAVVMTITGSNVGIGTSTPVNASLHIANPIASETIRNQDNSAYNSFYNNAGTTRTGYIQFNASSPSAIVLDIAQPLTFNTNGIESMRIRADQNVGIGTGGLSNYRLYVKGIDTTSSNGAFIVQNNADTMLLSVRNDGLFGTGTAANSPYNLTVTGRDCYIDNTGYLGYLSSVRESKININNIENVDWLLNLNPVSFNKRKKDEAQNYTDEFYEELDYGLIAEEVELINDQICFYDETEEGRIIKGVSYSKLITPMLKAIQELKAENDTLKERLTALENR